MQFGKRACNYGETTISHGAKGACKLRYVNMSIIRLEVHVLKTYYLSSVHVFMVDFCVKVN